MSPKSLQDLNLKDEALPTAGQALDDLPQFGQFVPPPQPGAFRFQLPKDLSAIWDTFEIAGKGTRITAVFDQNNPLIIVQSPGGKYNTEPFHTRLNNNERPRGKDKVLASDLDYLIAAFNPKTPKPASNKAYIELVRTFAGKQFGADIRYSWRCSKERNIRVADKEGNVIELQNKPGCGAAYYQEDVERQPNGEYPLQIQCSGVGDNKCGGLLRAFANLDNIRA